MRCRMAKRYSYANGSLTGHIDGAATWQMLLNGNGAGDSFIVLLPSGFDLYKYSVGWCSLVTVVCIPEMQHI